MHTAYALPGPAWARAKVQEFLMKKKSFKVSSDTIVSFSAIVIAIASVVVTIWQGIETRKYNRLSVRPKLGISFESGKSSFGLS